ncbi:MAG: M24 family metallopeptidase [Chloroflexota bacterium]
MIERGPRENQRQRREDIQDQLEKLNVDAIVLRKFANFAWYTGGGDNRVDRSSETGVADIVVTRDGDYVLTSNIEAKRLREEQTPGIEIIDHPWYEPEKSILRDVAGGGRIASDLPRRGESEASDRVATLRRRLDGDAIERYRSVGYDTYEAVVETAGALRPGMTEDEAVGLLHNACTRRGMFAAVAMAAGDERIELFRHPIPHGNVFHRRVMLVVCAERGGLYGNFTMFHHFDSQDRGHERRMHACQEILLRMRTEATLPGRTLSEAFADCCRYYAEAGYADEWRLHHQGGMTGYATREVVATPDTHHPMEIGHAFAWNPSITGGKAEETFVITAMGADVLTRQRV